MMEHDFGKGPLKAVALMRILIGWHFLYEGVLKLFTPNWTSKAYLISAELFTPFFTWLASDSLIGFVDYLNIACLILVGISLMIGYLERSAALVGIMLLAMYYLAHPPFIGMTQLGTEGSYWIVNKNLIEAAALFVLYKIPTGNYFGLRIFKNKLSKPITP